MKRYFAIAGLLFLALTINIAWTGKAPWLGFWGLTATFVFGTLFTGVGMCIGEWFRRFTHPVRIPAKLNSHSGQREHPDP
ncbi:MAG: hypothetical protein ACRCVK_10420 [Aeromonas veronii]